jgi:hypothetical protein
MALSGVLAQVAGSRAQSVQVELLYIYKILFAHDLFRKTGSHFSGSCAASRRRVAGSKKQAGSAAMVAVAIVMIVPAMAFAGRFAAHGDAAGWAELRVLCVHASGDLRHVGDDVGTKPHRIGRARLARGIAALGTTLGGRAVETTKKRGEQDSRTGQVNNPHIFLFGGSLLRE